MKRKLSVLEHLIFINSQKSPENFAIMARINGLISTVQIQNVLSHLKKKHPLLSTRITFDNQEIPYFISDKVPEFSVRVLPKKNHDHWQKIVAEELELPFPWQTGPLVRFVLIESKISQDLIVICDHCVADALSLAYLTRDILYQLGHPENNIDSLPQLPGIDELIPSTLMESVPQSKKRLPLIIGGLLFILISTYKVFQGIKTILNWLTFKFMPRSTTIDLVSKKQLENDFFDKSAHNSKKEILTNSRLRIFSWYLPQAETSQLINRCKQEQTSVHAALCTACLLALNEIKEVNQSCIQKVASPISIRNRLSLPVGESFGFFAGRIISSVNYKLGMDFWDMARNFKQDLTNQIRDDKLAILFFRTKAILPIVANSTLRKYFFSILKFFDNGKLNYDLAVSNLGRLDFPIQYGSLTLEAMYGPIINTNEGENILGVCTIGNQLYFNFVCKENKMEISMVEKWKEKIIFLLRKN